MADDTTGLTRREQEVLRGILERKTAKEMALDLGISHHAVEKRLKRARHKLGAATSLEAARLYDKRYGETVSGPSDLGGGPADGANLQGAGRFPARRLIAGVSIIMIIISIAALMLAHPTDKAGVFEKLDSDRSGTIELAEFLDREASATRVTLVDGTQTSSSTVEGTAAAALMAEAFEEMDADRDGRLTEEEFSVSQVTRTLTLDQRR